MQNITQQIQVNQEFLKKVSDDPTLAQRLAERQMKVIPEGEHVVDLMHEPEGMSPFQLVNVAPPAPLPPYRPVGGRWRGSVTGRIHACISSACRWDSSRRGWCWARPLPDARK